MCSTADNSRRHKLLAIIGRVVYYIVIVWRQKDLKGQEQLTGDEQMIDANGGGSFANIDRKQTFSLPMRQSRLSPPGRVAGLMLRCRSDSGAMLARFGRECWIGRATGVERLDLRRG